MFFKKHNLMYILAREIAIRAVAGVVTAAVAYKIGKKLFA
jgi:hypothetical protein